MEEVSLAGQVAIVTGAGRGLGRSYADDLARRGAKVVVNDMRRNPEYGDTEVDTGPSAADLVAQQIEREGGTAISANETIATFEAAMGAYGTVDVVVHNAGNRQNAYFEALTDEQVQSVLAVHLLGAFRLLSPVWPVMQANHYGRVVLIGSSVGAYGMEGISNYGAAKAGLIGLTKSLALEGGDHGILVNCVLPQADTAATSGRPKGRTLVSRASQEVASARARMGSRVGAELVAPLVSFLASRQCEVTGEVFSCGAGTYARVFTGVTRGWTSPTDQVTAEDVRDHLELIRSTDEWLLPRSAPHEMDIFADAYAELVQGSPNTR